MSGWMLMDSTDGWLHWVKFKATLESWTVPCREQSYMTVQLTFLHHHDLLIRLRGIWQLTKCGRHQVRLWLQCVRSLDGLSVGQFARCQSNDRWGYVTTDIPDWRTDRPKDGHTHKAFFLFYLMKKPNNCNGLPSGRTKNARYFEGLRKTTKIPRWRCVPTTGVSLINPISRKKKREFKSETPSTRRSRCQALFTAVIRLPPHTSGS